MKRCCLLLVASLGYGEPSRLKDLLSLEGVRDNQLLGYGIVVGLAGTGDKQLTLFSTQSLTNMLRRMGITVDPAQMQVRNMASVMVSANLPPFAQPGTKIDVTASAIGDAKSLQGGVLLMTPLKAADGQVYAVAQGPIITGGFSAGRGGSSQTVNHPTVGRTPDGGIVERAPPSVSPSSHFKLQLRQADFTTAARVVDVLNQHFSAKVARAESPGVVAVDIPASYSSRPIEFVAELESLSVEADKPAKVVINERTGTIVIGKDVRISPVSIMHGSLTVEVRTKLEVSQPEPLSGGKTVVTPQVDVAAKEEKAKNIILPKGATVEDLVRALQAIGSTPRDVIAILQNLRTAGALDAAIEVI
ncbi:MAG TPA: flagellar basal body P-ring protein FlgI [Bryobacteraceae bacterium]|jgi:flagellar P-ring protein precursor FlgI|nr:flagellar basal body P-ring protein FlgI [Bryobacteraceae bacterium]